MQGVRFVGKEYHVQLDATHPTKLDFDERVLGIDRKKKMPQGVERGTEWAHVRLAKRWLAVDQS